MVLQVLYDNIKDKKKVLTGKCVQSVDMTKNGVVVKTTDGSSYHGDILVGADGIHSTIREEMWKIAHKKSPGWIAADEYSREFTSLSRRRVTLIQPRPPLRLRLCFWDFQSLRGH